MARMNRRSSATNLRFTGRLRRRGVIVLTGTALLVTAIGACSSSGSSGSTASSGSGGSSSKTLVFGGLGGTFQTGVQSCIIAPFEKQTGITVQYVVGEPTALVAKAIAQKSNPSMDLIWDTSPQHYTGLKAGVFAKVPASAVPNYKYVPSSLHYANGYGVRVATISEGIVYQPSKLAAAHVGAPTTWSDLWTNSGYKGRLVSQDISAPYMQATLIMLAQRYGGSQSNMTPAFDKLKLLAKNYYGVTPNDSQLETWYAQGQAWVGMTGASRALEYVSSGLKLNFIQPAGPIPAIPVGIDLVSGSKHNAAALKFLNYFLSASAQNCLTQPSISYDPASSQAKIPAAEAKYFPSSASASRFINVDWETEATQLKGWTTEYNSILKNVK